MNVNDYNKNKTVYSNDVFGYLESQRLKGILIILMFWSHLFNHPEKIPQSIEWISLINISGKSLEVWLVPLFHVAVPLFFFISGYGYRVTERKKEYNLHKLLNQIKKLYLKYWIVFFVLLSPCFFLNKFDWNVKEYLLNFVGISSSYVGEWWFLSTYFEILILFFLIKKVKIFNNPYRIMLFSLVLGGMGYLFKILCMHLGIELSVIWVNEIYYLLLKFPMFVIGYFCCSLNILTNLYYKIKDNNFCKFCVFIIVIFFPYIFSFIPETFFEMVYLPIFVLGYLLCNRYLEKFRAYRNLFEMFGRKSAYMWLTHSLLLYTLLPRIVYLPKLSILCWIVLIFITYICSTILTKIEYLLLKSKKWHFF